MTQSTSKRCGDSASACTAPAQTTPSCALPTVTPRADMWETEDAAHLTIEVPGIADGGIELQIENDRMTLTATPEGGTVDGRALRGEWRQTRFQRTFLLTDDADRDGIEAHLRHGLLTVRIPRRAEKRPRSVPVRVTAG